MNSSAIRILFLAAVILTLSPFCRPHTASAQYPGLGDIAQQNMAFDQQFNEQLNGMMMQNQMQQQQLLQNYKMQNGAQLQREYQQFVQSTGTQISYDQFVWSHIMTAGGTNPGPALQQQQRNFQAQQQAHRTVQEGYDSYNKGYWNNQQILDGAAQRYDQGAIRGNGNYLNPQTGQTYELPYGGSQQAYTDRQDTFAQDSNGQYHQIDPRGYSQQLEEYNPPNNFWDD